MATAAVLLMPVVGALLSSCSSEAAPAADPAAYRAELTAICAISATERDALVEPADDLGVGDFARSVADLLGREAEAARALRPPDDLDADHRSFVQNTADQAARWTALADAPATDPELFGQIQTDILELTLGRDDLSTAMDVPGCRVAGG